MATTVVGPGTPYITPAVLTGAPTGISWSTIPNAKATPEQQLAEQLNICLRATSMVDGFCNTPLRATIDTETVRGPDDWRFSVGHNGVARIMLSRPPVVSVISGQYCPTSQFPPSWTTIPVNQFKVEIPLLGVYGTTAPGMSGEGGNSVLLAPGYAPSQWGRRGTEVQITYLNGWPHGQLTANAAVGATTLSVDDVTGWAGAVGILRDTVGQEAVSVVSTTPSGPTASGPGTLTLASGLVNAHSAGVLVTTLPGAVTQAAILFAVSQALVRGATAITVQNTSGQSQHSRGAEDYAAEAELLIQPFRRIL